MIYPWKRYWIKQGENPSMENGLFVEPIAEIKWFGAISNGAPMLDLRDIPCLVLLGDVGMGKSTSIKEDAKALGKMLEGQKHAVVCLDLKRLPETLIERCIFQNDTVLAWLRGEHKLTLFLDSFDECWRRIDALEIILVEWLESRINERTPPLYLRLTCRSAEWRGEVGKLLERVFSKRVETNPPVQIFVLAPLSKSNVSEAARLNNLDGTRLLESITAKEAGALASHPITLEMLLDIYQRSGDFPKSRTEPYLDGCLRLCCDRNASHGSIRQTKTTPQQRLIVASRLAGLSVYTNRYLINGDFEKPISRSDVLEAHDAVGYVEEQVGGEQIQIDRDTISETLQTGLFAERIEGTQSWRHQSYAEFLAAHYAKQRNLAVSQIVSLLTDVTKNSQKIIPQLEETACWMAEIIPAVFQALAKDNADVFLRCDPTYWHEKDRALLAERYLDLVRRHEAPELSWQMKYRFGRLAHRELAAQLHPAITDQTENPLVRQSAIDIAGSCGLREVAATLIDTLLSSEEHFLVRQSAGTALHRLADDNIRTLLKQKEVTEWINDSNDDLKGLYLQILWPSKMSVEELIPLLSPPQRNSYSGMYKLFLQYDLPSHLQDEDLSKMLDWLRENHVNFDILGKFGYLPSKLFVRGLTKMDQFPIRDAVLRLLHFDETQLHHQFYSKHEIEEIPEEARLHFWRAVVDSDLDIGDLIIYGSLQTTGVLLSEDVVSFIKELQASSDFRIRDRWRIVVFSVFRIDNLQALELLSDLARAEKAVARDLEAHTSCQLLPDEKNRLKKAYQREKEKKTAERVAKPSFVDIIRSALDAFDSGKTDAFWSVRELLNTDPDNLDGGLAFPKVRVSQEKAWNHLPADLKRRILDSIPTYLERQAINLDWVWDLERGFRPYDVLHPVLFLLFDEDKNVLNSLSSEIWSKWMCVLFAYRFRQNGSHDEALNVIFAKAFLKDRESFFQEMKHHLEARINNDSQRQIIWSLKAVWCNEIK